MSCLILGVPLCVLVLTACQPRQPSEPIVAAVARNEDNRVTQYLAEGGDPNFVSRLGDPLLYTASGPNGGPEVLILLIKAGANPNATSRDGRTALQNAASWCDVEIATILIDAGANVNMVGKDNKIALDVICKSPEEKRMVMSELLTRAGAVGE